jgi:phosphoglycerol geranylgeranyltransferase
MVGRVEQLLRENAESKGYNLMILIDPPNQDYDKAGRMAREAEEGGADVILVGGSSGAQGEFLDETIKAIKQECSLPVLIFPGNVGSISKYADAIYFMSMLNSRNPYWISQVHALAAPIIKRIGIEAIPTAYLVVEPGEIVGFVGDANALPKHKPYMAAYYALAGEMLGMRVVLFDCGSGAPEPVTPEFVKTVRGFLKKETLLICAGGIKTPKQASELVKAGADGLHIGTSIERSRNIRSAVEKFKKALERIAKRRR